MYICVYISHFGGYISVVAYLAYPLVLALVNNDTVNLAWQYLFQILILIL